MRKMKGVGPAFVLGLVMIIIVTVIFVLDKTVEYDERATISSSARYAYDTLSASEELKRTTDSAVGFAAVQLTSLGAEGGGFIKWSRESPTMEDLVEKYTDELESSVSEVKEIEDFRGMTVGWRTANIELEYSDKNITLTGSNGFVIMRHENPQVMVQAGNNFKRTAQSSYFRLLQIGRNLFENQRWKVDEDVISLAVGDMGDECKEVTNTTYEPVVEDFLKYSFQCGLEGYDGLASLDSYTEDEADLLIYNIADELGFYLRDEYGFDFNITAEKDVLERTDSVLVKLRIDVIIEDEDSLTIYEEGFDSLRLEFSTNYQFDVPKEASPE
ncbi:MAG: hypothetical protein ACE5J7_00240 [Candidatus Aenigmatarchaeota archaeon]